MDSLKIVYKNKLLLPYMKGLETVCFCTVFKCHQLICAILLPISTTILLYQLTLWFPFIQLSKPKTSEYSSGYSANPTNTFLQLKIVHWQVNNSAWSHLQLCACGCYTVGEYLLIYSSWCSSRLLSSLHPVITETILCSPISHFQLGLRTQYSVQLTLNNQEDDNCVRR